MGHSSDTLLHQTGRDAFYRILEDKMFRCSYCKDQLNGVFELSVVEFPMISFSDIPFSSLSMHLQQYGDYTIGMSKDWAKASKLNPVLYLEKNTELSNLMFNELKYLNNELTETLFAFSKNYEGYLKTNKLEYSNYRFSDEREWRFVPTRSEYKKVRWISNNPSSPEIKQSREYAKKFGVAFQLHQVNYLIVEELSEKIDLFNRYSNFNINVFTNEEIRKNFLGGNANKRIYLKLRP